MELFIAAVIALTYLSFCASSHLQQKPAPHSLRSDTSFKERLTQLTKNDITMDIASDIAAEGPTIKELQAKSRRKSVSGPVSRGPIVPANRGRRASIGAKDAAQLHQRLRAQNAPPRRRRASIA